jgi:anthranilate phosphoribosyltransferase
MGCQGEEMKKAIEHVICGRNLTEEDAYRIMELVMEGAATPAQIAAFLAALRFKGETVEEITGFARAMRRRAAPFRCPYPLVVDTCGTGGDGAQTFNISTTVAFVVAGAGVPVAKHGNRSVSSRCGSADLLEALQVNINLEPEAVEACLNRLGIAFLFAPVFHGAMKHAAAPRREIGIRTVFNILGPLVNPAGAAAQVVGVFGAGMVGKLGRVLARLGTRRSFVVHGYGGLDEISLSGPSLVCEVNGGEIREYTVDPADYSLPRAPVEALKGGSPEENARLTLEILQGSSGPRRDAVLVNAAFALLAAGTAGDLAEGLQKAAKSIDSGAALAKLNEVREFTRYLGKKEETAL